MKYMTPEMELVELKNSQIELMPSGCGDELPPGCSPICQFESIIDDPCCSHDEVCGTETDS